MRELAKLLKTMSQAELARKLNITKMNISHWKRNKKVPKYRLIQLKELLNEQR